MIADLAGYRLDTAVVALLQQTHREFASGRARFAVASLDSRARELLGLTRGTRRSWSIHAFRSPTVVRRAHHPGRVMRLT